MNGNQILIIEDNPMNLELATDLLEANGFAVASAQTAEEGLRLARELLPDLVLMDFSLPGMDGLSATRAIRTLEAGGGLPRLPIIVLSANVMREHVAASAEAGADDHIGKPVRAETLIKAVLKAAASAGTAALVRGSHDRDQGSVSEPEKQPA